MSPNGERNGTERNDIAEGNVWPEPYDGQVAGDFDSEAYRLLRDEHDDLCRERDYLEAQNAALIQRQAELEAQLDAAEGLAHYYEGRARHSETLDDVVTRLTVEEVAPPPRRPPHPSGSWGEPGDGYERGNF